jgi:predicted Zn-dependent protease
VQGFLHRQCTWPLFLSLASALQWSSGQTSEREDGYMQLEERIATTEESLDADLLIRQALERGLIEEAGEAIDDLIAADPDHHEGWFLKGVRGLLRGDCADAAGWFDEALARGADRRAARLGRAMAELRDYRPADAWTTLTDLLDDEPGDHEVIHWLLRAGAALERWEDLAEHLEEHLSSKPEDHAARFAYAGVSLRLGRVGVAQHQHDLLRKSGADLMGLDELAELIEPEFLTASAA